MGTDPNQLAIMPLANSQVAEQEAQLREALIVVKYLEEQVPNLQKPNEVIADIPQPNESIARQKKHCKEWFKRSHSSRGINEYKNNKMKKQEQQNEKQITQQIVAAPSSMAVPEIENAPLAVTADRRFQSQNIAV